MRPPTQAKKPATPPVMTAPQMKGSSLSLEQFDVEMDTKTFLDHKGLELNQCTNCKATNAKLRGCRKAMLSMLVIVFTAGLAAAGAITSYKIIKAADFASSDMVISLLTGTNNTYRHVKVQMANDVIILDDGTTKVIKEYRKGFTTYATSHPQERKSCYIRAMDESDSDASAEELIQLLHKASSSIRQHPDSRTVYDAVGRVTKDFSFMHDIGQRACQGLEAYWVLITPEKQGQEKAESRSCCVCVTHEVVGPDRCFCRCRP